MLSEKGDGKLIKWEKEQEWQRLNEPQPTKRSVIASGQPQSGVVKGVTPTTKRGEEWDFIALTITGEASGE
jgi:hypothetical protein